MKYLALSLSSQHDNVTYDRCLKILQFTGMVQFQKWMIFDRL